MRLVIATRNKAKLHEIQTILGKVPLKLLSLQQFPHLPEIKETGRTYEANALNKALTLFKATGLPILAEDSGLEVKALGNRPGIYSARYAGPNATPSRNNQKLLRELKSRLRYLALAAPARASGKGNPRPGKIPLPKNRQACYRCVAVLIIPSSRQPAKRHIYIARGVCRGKIALSPKGQNGFGYDPLFIPHGYRKTFGELSVRIKNQLSHRAKALRKIKSAIMKYLS